MDQSHIRNFCIVAHIDHGKSTLADRMIEMTHTLTKREMQDQVLDNMDLERERGITIKSQAVRLIYHAKNGEEYIFNLIDTPGHVDFNYEVSRSLAACDGAILVVDAAQGIEAQTLANVYLALDHDLEVLPVINKIDLPSADPDKVAKEIEDVIGLDCENAPRISAKTGQGVDEVLEQVITQLPAPTGDADAPLKALIFDSLYDSYRGVIVFVRIREGKVKPKDRIRMMASSAEYDCVEVGYFGAGQFIPCDELSAGMVGYITASIKDVRETRVGDTVTLATSPAACALPGYRPVKPMVFCGIYPADGAKYPELKDALLKLQLNDAALTFEPETSQALGFGFRCGFLGLLHLDVVQERLEREYDLDLVTTAPGVVYKVHKTDGTVMELTNPSNLPDPSEIEYMEEPVVDAEIMVTSDYIGPIMDLCQERRGQYVSLEYIEETRAVLKYVLPLNEIIYDFFDVLKSRSRGYASFDYELKGYQQSELVKLDILINHERVDALSFIVFKDTAYDRARKMCEKLKENIPR
ncbi:MAG: translation elongation factor 4, partial [Lachnospiraceae bacterium]|nr:translation elongation factor 4 [Lachnospiraceae bacterium]